MSVSYYGDSSVLAIFQGGIAVPPVPGGSIFYVDGTNGSDTNDGTSPSTALKTLSAAYAKCTSDKHDVIYVIPSDTGVLETAAITWAKDYTDVIGLGPVRQVGNRARIVCNATDLSPFFTISAHGCLFRNVMFWQGQDDVHSLINVSVTGDRNKFESVHFAGGGHATQAIDGGASLHINGGSENEFEDCTIGVDTIDAATGMAALVFAETGGAARNLFRECRFTICAGATSAIFVEMLGDLSTDRYTIFDRCLFINTDDTYSLTSAFVLPATNGPKRVLLKDCACIGADDWDSSNRGILYLNTGTITAGGNSGLMQASNAT